MKYVLDATIAARWYIPQHGMVKALQLRLDYRLGVHELLAPDYMPIECGELLLRAERSGVLSTGDTETHLLNLASLNIPIHANSSLLHRASVIALQTNLSIASGVYLALAEQENCHLLTNNQKLIKNTRKHFSFVVSYDSLP
jgi:predicted nucleic acid-binding protein